MCRSMPVNSNVFFSLKGILVMDSRSHLVAGNFIKYSEIVGCELF